MIGVSGGLNDDAKYVRLERNVLVLGGGISGIIVSEALALAGIQVTIAEKTKFLGRGNRTCFSSFEPGKTDNWIDEKISRLGESDKVTLITEAAITRLDGHFGSFKATIKKNNGQKIQVSPSVVIAATGYATERNKAELPDGGNVCYLTDLAVLLSNLHDRQLSWNNRPLSNVVFLLDLVNDDLKIDSEAALHCALTLREIGCEVSVLSRDLKVSFTGGERLYLKAREAGVLFFKYDAPLEYFMTDDMVSIYVPDNAILNDDTREQIMPDLLIVPETCMPGSDTDTLCRLLGINIENGGYIMDDNPQFSRIRSNRRGIYVVGACRFPQSLMETLSEAEATAQEIISLLATGIYEIGSVIAEVDARKCALCYTCPRLCPHGAIKIEKYAEQNVYCSFSKGGDPLFHAARVEPVACYGCGICVAECPARAITLCGEQSANQFLARM